MKHAILSAMVLLIGCASRIPLTPKEVDRVAAQDGLLRLRVYPSRRMVLVHHRTSDQDYAVQKSVNERSEGEQLRLIVSRGVPGLIIDITESHAMPVFWVSFDPACGERSCAFGFVSTEDDRFELMAVPGAGSEPKPRIHRMVAWPITQMRPARRKALSEANEILLTKTRRPKSIVLDIRKRHIERTHRGAKRLRGVK